MRGEYEADEEDEEQRRRQKAVNRPHRLEVGEGKGGGVWQVGTRRVNRRKDATSEHRTERGLLDQPESSSTPWSQC